MWTRIPLLVIFIPLPSVQHFIWPLNNCVLADICNHTWIPECGAMGKIFRLFIDECDMFEFNCDRGANYIITNYTDCFGPATGCPPWPGNRFLRIGDYKYMEEKRQIVYAPTTPSLPARMLKGKRRYTPTPRMKRREHREVITTVKLVITPKNTVVLRRVSVMKNGRMMIKVVKGLKERRKHDSDFLE
ncbi:uncharacterized protein LOC115454229 [Manduca sexta]|uniref:uncharacterized protein LOC115454229 n=1 Tax=Manduca sexta TaxID=7130 RepID=UPI00188EBF20|nr:uncharacterized protein LOC115454229 [Manduca sexta]